MKILISAPVCQNKEKLIKYLKSLDNLKLPQDVKVDRYFILHNCYDRLYNYFSPTDILVKLDDNTKYEKHDWKDENFNQIVQMKNNIKDYALNNGYDYIFMVDSDLVLHEQTLNHLYKILEGSGENVIGEIFYTDWDKSGKMLPNAWDLDSYSFISDPRERYKKENINIYEVGGTGACILIRTKIFENKSINYDKIKNVSFSFWEDRAFCIRCSINNIRILLDTSYPCEHLYH